ncbi:MAG: hypothetical protein IEMM0002_1380 [bacterium]|nr:MAG: hypothetical protein IEMM0002_1380 [bacterium]
MKNRRKFTNSFKREVVEEILSNVSTRAQICRRHEISSSVVKRWEEKYAAGRLTDGPSPEHRQQSKKIYDLERMVGKLTMENDLLKKAVEFTLSQRNENSCGKIAVGSSLSKKSARLSG